jgi:hypothetical protein
MELVCDMIEQLDKAAQPQGEVEVIQYSGDISAASLQQALKALGAEPVTATTAPGVMRGRGNRDRPEETEK